VKVVLRLAVMPNSFSLRSRSCAMICRLGLRHGGILIDRRAAEAESLSR
jgi:hypothetical protein